MRKFSKLVALAMAIVMVAALALTGCNKPDGALAQPSSVTYADGTLTWSAVEGATSYDVTVYKGKDVALDTQNVKTTSLSVSSLAAGNYTAGVVAKADGKTSSAEKKADFTVAEALKELATPTGFAYDEDKITWTAVAGATAGYAVKVVNESGATVFEEDAVMSAELDVSELAAGKYTVTVTANAVAGAALASKTASYEFTVADAKLATPSGGAVDVSAWADEVAAIVYAGFNGERGNRAVANVLAGKVSPSGKLSETFPVCLEDTPYYDTYRDVTVARYTDGVDVGYRYYETAGLSYAEFEYGDLEIELKGGLNAEVSYTVKNISDYDGKEISQLYVRDAVAFVYRPDLELKGYAKNYIKAGDCAEVKLTLDRSSFAYYSAAKDEWIVEDGVFNVFVGASVKDIRLEAAVVVENGGIVKVKIL